MLSATIANGHVFWLVLLAIGCAAISVYYYFRVIQAMYFKEGEEEHAIATTPVFKALLVVVAVLLIVLGLFPQWLIDNLYNPGF